MAIESKLSNIRKLTNASLNSIIDITNLNFKDLSEATLLFLDTIDYEEASNSINGLTTLNSDFVNVNNRFTMNLNGVPTWTIDSQGRAEGKSFLVEIAEAKRYRHIDFPDWPDQGTVGEIIYTGIQNQRPEFGEDFIGYLDGRGWVSLTGDNPQQGIFILQEIGSPGIPDTPPTGSGLVWIGNPGLANVITPTTQELYFTDENGDIFSVILGGGGGADSDWITIGTDLKQGTTGNVLPNIPGANNLGTFSSRWNAVTADSIIFGSVPGMSILKSGGDLSITSSIGGAGDINLTAGDDVNMVFNGSAIIGNILTITNTGLQYTDGTENTGYVLTSDALGNASWQPSGGGGGGGGTNVSHQEIINVIAGVPFTITHNLQSEYIQLSTVELPSEVEVDTSVSGHTLNTVDVTSSVSTKLRVTVLSAGGPGLIGDDGDWIILGSPAMDLQMGVPGNVLPFVDDMNDLGEPLLRWKDIYLGSKIDFLTDLTMERDGIVKLAVEDTSITAYENIVITSGHSVISSVGGGELSLNDSFGPAGTWSITSDNRAYGINSAWVYGQPNNGTQLAYQIAANEAIGISINHSNISPFQFNGKEIIISDNRTQTADSGFLLGRRRAIFIGADNSTIAIGLQQTVIAGATGVDAKASNALYSNELRLQKAVNNFDGIFDIGTLTDDRTYTFQDESGIVPVGPNWDTLIANPTVTENGMAIVWNNVANKYELVPNAGGGADSDWATVVNDLQQGTVGNILPNTDSTNNLGTDLLKWLNVHTAGTLYIESDSNISLNGTTDTNGLYYNSITNEVILYSDAGDDIRISGNTGSQVILESDSNKQMILKTNGVLEYDVDRSASYTNRSVVDKEYIDSVVGGGFIQIATPDDKSLATLTTTADGDLASNSGITNTPIDGCYVAVYINGIEYQVGNGVTTSDCYFSDGTSPSLAKGFSSGHVNGQIQAGDLLHWNGTVAGFELQNAWRVAFHYLVNQ